YDGAVDISEDEIALKRKLYRSGESEYMINGRSVRLKDINELFMDTGLGRDGYSIIGQGRIAEIVGAKSNERRDIFEEASGISKFRYKKTEAERKLSASQENLVRLTDILSELENRVEPLRIQAEKAEKYVKLAEERRKVEISVWVSRLDELRKNIEQLDEKILISRTNYERSENDIAEQEKRLEDGYRKMQESTIKSDKIRRKMIEEEQTASELKSGIAVLENDIRHCELSEESAKKSIADAEKNIKSIYVKKSETAKIIESLENQRAELVKEIHQTEKNFQKIENESSQLGENVDRIGAEINSLYIRRSELNFACESAKKLIAEENPRMVELREKNISYKKMLGEYSVKINNFKKSICENEEQSESLKKRLDECKRLYTAEKEQSEEAKRDFEKVLFELREKEQKIKILLELERNMEGFTGSVKAVLRASAQGKIGGISGTVAQNTGTEQRYALAVETALGGAVQNIIVENEERAKQCINFLRENKSGRATFLPITSVKGREIAENGLSDCRGFVAVASQIVTCKPELRGIIMSLLGRTVIAENIDRAVEIARKFGYKFRIVTLDGQVINAGGSFTGGSAQKSAGIITRKNEIERLNAEIQALSLSRDRLCSGAEKTRLGAEKLRAETEKIRSEIVFCSQEIIRINAEISGLESLSEQIKSQAENNFKLIEECEEKIKSATAEIEVSGEKLAEISGKISLAEQALTQGQDSREKFRRSRSEFAEKLSDLKIKETEILKDIQVQKNELFRIDTEKNELERTMAKALRKIAELKKTTEDKSTEIDEIRRKLVGLKDNTGDYLEKIKSYQAVHTEQSRIVNELRHSMKDANAEKERFSAEITRLEERHANVSRDYDNIIKQLLEVYELTRSEAVEVAERVDDMVSAQRKLNELKNKIKSLGNVNTEAIGEYKEVSERYEFMSEQVADVRKSKAELERIISGLTDEMKRIFAENFNIINQNFKEIFTELFGGGKAELVLTDPENILESGIEIAVAPPGKVIKNLISLSGGEQSFVAIAIYFAILKLRPAPFCILDEIDAALDEVNVRKYAQYLKKFTDTTQFVLVTHRRSAMEEANVLYGVTMQEDGISKLLKMEQVDFQEDTADIQ
ncbi:MAG: chromosome segregation protein SMC, partial [Ruminococcus sp.]|nr:chromosome segregation protein SMC [Ruminococcus sp.]